MSKTFWDKEGKQSESVLVDNMNKCKWLCDEVCCNTECDYLADYPQHKCESIEECELFEKEDGII